MSAESFACESIIGSLYGILSEDKRFCCRARTQPIVRLLLGSLVQCFNVPAKEAWLRREECCMGRYVILGNGVAGTRAAEMLRDLDQDAEIVVVTEEVHPFYRRPLLVDYVTCLLYTSDAADEEDSVDLGG